MDMTRQETWQQFAAKFHKTILQIPNTFISCKLGHRTKY